MDHQDPALESDDSTHAVVMTDAGRSADPLLVEVTRGALVESRHRGRAAIVDAHARVLACWGDLDRPVYPRSAVKPLQALPLVESGAADAFALTETELALACASHNGEPAHTQTVAAWLARIGCTVDDLACGAHEPVDGGTDDGGEPVARRRPCTTTAPASMRAFSPRPATRASRSRATSTTRIRCNSDCSACWNR